MTIPVVPGPWNFIAEAGQGVANVINARTQRDLREQDEARKHLAFIFDAVQKGALSTSALKSPAFLGLVHKSGIGDAIQPQDIAPNPGEQIRAGQSQMIQHILGGGTPEIPDLAAAVYGPQAGVGVTPATAPGSTPAAQFLLSSGRIPTSADLAGQRADVAKSNLATSTAETALPENAPTVIAGQQGEQDKTFNDIADRVVADLYSKTGRIPSPTEAFGLGQRDARAGAFGSRINEPYYAGAIQRLRARLAAEETARVRAATYASNGPQDRTVRDIATQQRALHSQIATRQTAIAQLTGKLSALAKYQTYDKMEPGDRKIMDQINALESANQADQTTLDGLTNQAGVVIGTTPKVSTNAPTQARQAINRVEWRRRAALIRQYPNDPRVKGKTVEELIGPEPKE